jgi:HEAT repeat protein
VRALIAELRSADATRRSRAAQSLGEQGAAAAGAVGALMEAVRDPVPFVRSAAAFALKRVRTR